MIPGCSLKILNKYLITSYICINNMTRSTHPGAAAPYAGGWTPPPPLPRAGEATPRTQPSQAPVPPGRSTHSWSPVSVITHVRNVQNMRNVSNIRNV